MPLDDARRAAAARAATRAARARGVAAHSAVAPRAGSAVLGRRARRPSRRASRPPISPRPRAIDAFLRIDAPGEHARARRASIPRGWPARRGRASRCARRRSRGAGAGRCGRRRPARSRRACRPPTSRRSSPRTLFLDRDDPVAAWSRSQRVAGAARSPGCLACSELRIEGEGTDLTVDVSGRTWVNSDGRRNMPSGEVFTGPIETSAEGRIHYSIPTSPRGLEVAGVSLEFREGVRRVRAGRAGRRCAAGDARRRTTARAGSARSGSARTSASTARSARRWSTRRWAAPSISRSAARIPRPAARTSRPIHWDMICDLRQGGRLSADGEPILVDGQFVQSD